MTDDILLVIVLHKILYLQDAQKWNQKKKKSLGLGGAVVIVMHMTAMVLRHCCLRPDIGGEWQSW